MPAQRIRNFAIEPYATIARALLYAAVAAAFAFFLTWTDSQLLGTAVGSPIVDARWWIGPGAVMLFAASRALHGRGRRA